MLSPRIAVALAAAVLLGAAAAPQPPYWAQQPSAAELAAAKAGVKLGARAVMVCKARADGGLEACRIAVETPANAGLGKAMLSLAPLYRLNLARPKPPAPGEDIVMPEGHFDVDTAPDWLRRPTAADLMAVWPQKALAAGRGGKAIINCMISQQGALYECIPVTESPAGEHFGDAAVALSAQFLMKPATKAGKPVVSEVSVPINFYMEPGSGARDLENAKGMVSASMAWPEAPGYAAVAAAYPAKARAAKLGGRATLACEFTREGRLHNCNTITEEPKHQGFGDAARVLSKQFRAFATLSNGKSIIGAGIQLPVVFDPAMLSGGQPVIGKAQWAGLPSGEDTSTAFGKLKIDATARVLLACMVLPGGAVSDCRVEQETPAGQGVGAAALSLAPHFRLTTWTAEGLPTVGGTISIPLRYEPTEPQPTPAK